MKICDYGCGQEAKYPFKNGKWCCSPHWTQCPDQRRRVSEAVSGKGNPMYQREQSIESRKRMSESSKNPPEETRRKMRRSQGNRLDNFGNWKGGYAKLNIPFFDTYSSQISFAEGVRRKNSDLKVLEVKCAYCGEWYVSTVIAVQERIRSLNSVGSDSRLYCSDKCKQECPIYKKIKYPRGFSPATSREVQPELRQMRFKIDNYTCQKCKKHQDELEVGLHCHHIEGIRWEPLESADLDKVITYCKTCHLEVHKIEGCGYHDMQCKGGE